MATELPFQQVATVRRFLEQQRKLIASSEFDRLKPAQRRKLVLTTVDACDNALKITETFMVVVEQMVKQAEAAASAAEAVQAAEQSVPPL